MTEFLTQFLTLDEAMAAEGRELVAAGERARRNGDDAEMECVAAALRDLGARHLGHAATLDRLCALLRPYLTQGGTVGKALAKARESGDSAVVGEFLAMLAQGQSDVIGRTNT